LLGLGRLEAARRVLRQASRGAPRSFLARLRVAEGLVHQTAGRLRNAVETYAAVVEEFPDVDSQVYLAKTLARELFVVAGDWTRVDALREESPREASPAVARRSRLDRWALLAIRGDHETLLAQVLDRVSGKPSADPDALADHLLLAFLYELTGRPERARNALAVLERTHGNGPLWRHVAPALFLLGKMSLDDLWRQGRLRTIFEPATPAPLFYMLGLVLRSRGDRKTATELFRMAVRSDPFNYWAALLARRELGTLTPPMKRFLR
jgi:tetratricopeptide (TPR) repeat protein